MTKAQHRKVVSEIMREFDWMKVHGVMEHLQWEWRENGVPSIKQMKDFARTLLDSFMHPTRSDSQEIGCGGFVAYRYGKDSYGLSFVVTDWYVEEPDAQ